MRFSNIVESITRQFEVTNNIIFLIEGAPGGGKSAAAAEVGKRLGFDRVVQFFPSLRDPVDFLGTPAPTNDVTVWRPPQEIVQLSTGRNLLIVEELSDAPVPVQNVMCGMFHDRTVGAVTLSPDTYIIATANRSEHKSGANRLVTKLAGRVRRIAFTEDLEDWEAWAFDNNIDPVLIQYLRFSGKLSEFDATADACPTPRNWARVSQIPTDLGAQMYFENVAGDVGEGAAAGYTAFRKIYNELPNLSRAIADPEGTEVPNKLDVAYATLGALVKYVKDEQTWDKALTYAQRFSPDMTVMFVQDAARKMPELLTTKSFIKFATDNQDVFF